MKDVWLDRYREAKSRERTHRDVMVGFNANLDRTIDAESFDLDVEPRHHEEVENMRQFREELAYGVENSINEEVDLSFDPEIDRGNVQVGGQAGIMSNFLSEYGHGVIFYTPMLSGTLAEELNEKILYPVMDGEFVLKNVRDSSNTDRTKENLIVEYESERTGRVIFSQKLRGFGPYFRKGVEENLDELENGFDRAIVSGFHDVEGNIESKLKKSAEQISRIDAPVHLEFVHREKTDDAVVDHLFDEADSLGLDENETLELADRLGYETDELSLGDAFQISKKLIERFDLSRIAIHTYRYHVTVTDDSYSVNPAEMRDGMLYGELCALAMADSGEISDSSLKEMDFEKLHMHDMNELEHFSHSLELENFVETGIAEIDGFNVVAMPTLIHEDPQRLVGMGDVISSGSFIGEIS